MNSESIQASIQSILTSTPPAFSASEAQVIAADHFRIHAQAHLLVSERDQNFRLDANNGERFTIKFSNSAEQAEVIEFQNRALARVAAKDPSFPLPHVISTVDDRLHCTVEHAGKTHFVRVLSWLDGNILNHATTDPGLAWRIGNMLARLGLAFEGFDHPGSNPPLLWDMKRASELNSLLEYIHDPQLKPLIEQTLNRFELRVMPLLSSLRTQVIHSDMNPGNILMDPLQAGRIAGLIDFGDMVKSPLIFDLAIASAYQIDAGPDPLQGALPLIAGYHALRPIEEIEFGLLIDLIKTRLATSLLIGNYRVRLFPENSEYLLISYDSAKNSLLNLNRQNADDALLRIRATCASSQ